MLPIQHPQFGVNPGHCVGGTGPTIQEAELTKERTRPQEGQRDFLSAFRCNSQLYLAGLNEVQGSPGISLVKDNRAPWITARTDKRSEISQFVRGEPGKKRNFLQDAGHTPSSPLVYTTYTSPSDDGKSAARCD